MNKLMIRTRHTIRKQTRRSSRYPEPVVVIESGCSSQVAAYLKKHNSEKTLVVTDKKIIKLKIMDEFVSSLRNEGIDYIVFNNIVENPTIDNVVEGVEVYRTNHCDSIIGFGGRAAMDGAKLIGAKVTNKKDVYSMKGRNRLWRRPPMFIAVPTIAGTGSEADFKAIVTDTNRFEKITVIDKKLLPEISYLDANLMKEVPTQILACSGMNLLAKTMESYLSRYRTKAAEKLCIETVQIVFNNLEKLYDDRMDSDAGSSLFTASYFSGRANMVALTGYGDLIGYFLSDAYGISHSYVLAVVFPYLLEMSRDKIIKRLSRLAVLVGLGDENEDASVLSDRIISRIKEMNANMGIPEYIEVLRERDIKVIAGIIEKNSNPKVPAPKILDAEDFEKLLYSVLKKDEGNKEEDETSELKEDIISYNEVEETNDTENEL
ncbi:Alcohol dehydrogenase, class IV [Dethiosulfatibacter aminovorans DSM 17477]|uniref:Alcohol dehydrogenase, class IV n=1 Tax=Dethiosulfatibacter aminovorans DSM 17477 TaxID=1121476 RepID=A0A1M6KAL7_9FIRM|nr:iron-containing alcohol dehydrogenase [Dethiosulfatibacter aminovorans]SHJ55966.1 Alcohol dehydrogenase, class IV [Dethiosulfatibacter aminovorans DSM 17477]